jgi:hypothetical protein
VIHALTRSVRQLVGSRREKPRPGSSTPVAACTAALASSWLSRTLLAAIGFGEGTAYWKKSISPRPSYMAYQNRSLGSTHDAGQYCLRATPDFLLKLGLNRQAKSSISNRGSGAADAERGDGLSCQ